MVTKKSPLDSNVGEEKIKFAPSGTPLDDSVVVPLAF